MSGKAVVVAIEANIGGVMRPRMVRLVPSTRSLGAALVVDVGLFLHKSMASTIDSTSIRQDLVHEIDVVLFPLFCKPCLDILHTNSYVTFPLLAGVVRLYEFPDFDCAASLSRSKRPTRWR